MAGRAAIDGTIPGKFWINLRHDQRWTQLQLPDLAYHEAIPAMSGRANMSSSCR
jgi:uncharacterized protein (DUF885 family)